MAEFSLGTAALGTEVDLSGLEDGIKESESKAESGFAKVGDVIGGALKVGVLAAGAAVVAAVAGIGIAAFDTASQVKQASNDIQASLGVTEAEANRLGDVALKVWGQNWGDSIEDVSASIVTVRQQMKGLADEELEAVTAKAFAIRDAFGVDVAESTNAANVLMEKFGLSSTEAFDMITKGFQSGLNNSGDFLESVTEYGVQFAQSGYDAKEFFSILETGQQGFSSLGTDKIADLVKEGRIRFMEMSDAVVDALKNVGEGSYGRMLGEQFGQVGELFIQTEEHAAAVNDQLQKLGLPTIDPEKLLTPLRMVDEKTGQVTESQQKFSDIFMSQILQGIESGAISVADAQQIAIGGMARMDNQVHQNTAGVALFGTQWEDLGADAVFAMDTMSDTFADVSGATDSLNAKYDNWPAMWEGIKRSALVAIEPLGGKLLELANDVMPVVQVGFDWLKNDLPPIIETVVGVIDTGAAIITELFNGPLATSLTENATFFQTTFSQVSEIVSTTVELIMIIVGALVGFFQAHRTEIMGIVSNTWNSIQALITGVLSLISGILKAFLLAAKGDFSGAWESIKQGAAAFVSGLLTALKNGLDNLKIIFSGPIDWIVEQWQALPGKVANVGAAIVNAIRNGIEREWGRLVNWFNDRLQELRDQLPFSEPKDTSSPLYGLSKSGEAIVTMLKDGMLAAAKGLPRAFAQGVGQPIMTGVLYGFESMLPNLRSLIDQVGITMKLGLKKRTDQALDDIDKFTESLLAQVEDMAEAMNEALSSGFSAEADINRLKAENLDLLAEVSETNRRYAEEQLKTATQIASQFADPAAGAAYLKMRSDQIFELAELQDKLSADLSNKERARLDAEIAARQKLLDDQMTGEAKAAREKLKGPERDKAEADLKALQDKIGAEIDAMQNQIKGDLTDAQRQRLEAQIDLISQAQVAAQNAFRFDKPRDRSPVQSIIDTIGSLLPQLPALFDDPTGTVSYLNQLLTQLTTSGGGFAAPAQGNIDVGGINITQLPGEDSQALAERVLRVIEQRLGGRI